MKRGTLPAAFPTLPLDEVATWAKESGFQSLEIAAWPTGGKAVRRYAGTAHIDVGTLNESEAPRIVDDLRSKGLTISALAYYPNPLDPDPAASSAAFEHLRYSIRSANVLQVPVVGTFVGRDKTRSVAENVDVFARVWPDLVHFAGDHGIKIAIENCPMIFSADESPG